MVVPRWTSHDPFHMSFYQIAGLIVLTVWLVESIVFIASYRQSLDS